MILSLWFPNWPIQLLQNDPTRNGHQTFETQSNDEPEDAVDWNAPDNARPILLYAMSKNALRVSARCHTARQAGVSIGMPVAEARTVLGDPVDVVEHNFNRDVEQLRELAVVCREFSPICGLDDCEHPDGLLLDIAGCGHLFGSDFLLGERAVAKLAAMGYRAKAGIGSTVGIAWAAARTSRDDVCFVSSDEQTAWLDRQPVHRLRIHSSTVEGLADFDLRTIGHMRRLPRKQLPSRFGQELLQRLDQADGTCPEPIEPVLPLEKPQASWRSEHPLRRPDLVEVVLDRLLNDLVRKLPSGVGATRIAVVIVAESKRVEFDVAFAHPTVDAKKFVDLVLLRLERLAMPAGVDRVSVCTADLDLITKTQTDLFGEPLDGENQRELVDLVEQLTGRLGAENVCYANRTPDPLPERSVEWVAAIQRSANENLPKPRALQSKSPSRKQGRTKRAEGEFATAKHVTGSSGETLVAFAPFTRPATLLRQPAPIRLSVQNHRPLRIEQAGKIHDVVRYWGPERIESGWWREDDQQRDYYCVEIANGDCFWLFWDVKSQHWFLHGAF